MALPILHIAGTGSIWLYPYFTLQAQVAYGSTHTSHCRHRQYMALPILHIAGTGSIWLYPHFTLALDEAGWSAPLLGRFTPWKGDSVPFVQEAGWVRKISPLTGVRTPDHEVHSAVAIPAATS